MPLNLHDERPALEQLVQMSGSLLDRQDFRGWLDLFDEQSIYEVNAYSTEIRKHMSWWKSDRTALEKMLEEIPRHVSDPSRRLHIISSPQLAASPEGVNGTANFAIYRTGPEGESKLYAVGHYEDRFVKRANVWRYASHRAVLQTRVLDIPTHVPI